MEMVGAWEADHLDMQRHHLLMRTTEHAGGISFGRFSPSIFAFWSEVTNQPSTINMICFKKPKCF